jgi:FkbM family methyltransferase
VQKLRFAAQKVVKAGFSSLGLHVRHSFQYPSALERKVLERHVGSADGVTCIFDVGANVGQSALAFEQDFPRAQIYAFEPFAQIYARLQANVAGRARIVPVHSAVGSERTRVEAYFDGGASSQTNRLTLATAQAGKGRLEQIEVQRLDDFCSERGIRNIDVLKTDTEGYDVEVLRGAERLLRERAIRVVIAETGFVGDTHHSPFEGVYQLLRPHGFEVAGVYEMTYLPDGRCDFCNVLYVRR